LATGTTIDTDRPVGGRFVRNLALSLSGGALLTVAGAAVAGADEAATASDGAGVTGTGDATAVGNTSGTKTNQGVAPGDGSASPTVVTQTAGAANVGVAVANTGGNVAVGNSSTNVNTGTQNATGGAIATSNNGSVANVSDGTAAIYTGNATAHGNVSDTTINQGAHGALGILTSQNAFVLNGGVAVANSGLNAAVGNTSTNTSGFIQTATNPTGLATNSASATNASNGSATIVTGAATATGNKSETWLDQTAGGSGDSDPGGLLVITQVGAVANLGAGIANSGGNLAVGNASTNLLVVPNPTATIAPTVVAPLTIASNQHELENSSDGTAHVHTGAATATGNDSSTNLSQTAWGDPSSLGAIVSVQAAGVANVGIGAANTGLNVAVGNVSDNTAVATQQFAGVFGPATTALGPVTASNAGSYSTSSDGTGTVRTGDATATGNTSWTDLAQDADIAFGPDGMGIVPNVQVAGVLNAGAAVANSGVNAAVGNAAGQLPFPNNGVAATDQTALVNPAAPLLVTGPITASNSADVQSNSDGTAKVKTGDATANGNTSATALHQSFQADADGMGLVVAPQVGVVVNAGLAVANSGVNAAVGNASNNLAVSTQDSSFDPAVPTLVVGPVTVSNSAATSNDSDGEACVCTGDATASGNVSTSTLNQDVMVNVGDGVTVLPTTGLILNLGLGVANSGVNLAVGNVSTNTATSTQTADLAAGAPALLVGPQTIGAAGGASNSSDGLGEVGTGRASAIGNLSDSDLDQTAVADGGGVIAPIGSTITNAGVGLANSGVNLGVGNASTNTSTLVQTASGVGTVFNNGEASNTSDGSGQIGDPNCDEKVVTPPVVTPPTEQPPGVAALPRTGGAIETMAAVGLMLLLLGLGAQGLSRRRLSAA
jgi:hypothetical protein